MHPNGHFLSLADFNARYDIEINFLEYESIKHAIPGDLKKNAAIEAAKLENQPLITNVVLKVKSSKEIYEELIKPLKKDPTCIKSWPDQYGIAFTEPEWKEIFDLPWKVTKHTKLIEFQCKILHKVYASNSYVSRFDITVLPNCEICMVKHNTKHFFVDCMKVRYFWFQFQVCFMPEIDITCNDILFGIFKDQSFALNYCLLHAKWYLHKEHIGSANFKNYRPSFQKYIMYLQNVLQIEECCYKLRNKVKLFTDNLGSIYDLVRRMSSNVM